MESTVLGMSACDLRWPGFTVQRVLAAGKECAYAKRQQIKISNCAGAERRNTTFNGSRYLNRNKTPSTCKHATLTKSQLNECFGDIRGVAMSLTTSRYMSPGNRAGKQAPWIREHDHR